MSSSECPENAVSPAQLEALLDQYPIQQAIVIGESKQSAMLWRYDSLGNELRVMIEKDWIMVEEKRVTDEL